MPEQGLILRGRIMDVRRFDAGTWPNGEAKPATDKLTVYVPGLQDAVKVNAHANGWEPEQEYAARVRPFVAGRKGDSPRVEFQEVEALAPAAGK